MNKFIYITALLIANLGFAQDYAQNLTTDTTTNIEDFGAPLFNMDELNEFAITANMEIGEVLFNAPKKVDFINIFNSDNQEIFSAVGTIIKNNRIDVSFLPKGTYYLEVIIGKNKGCHKLIK